MDFDKYFFDDEQGDGYRQGEMGQEREYHEESKEYLSARRDNCWQDNSENECSQNCLWRDAGKTQKTNGNKLSRANNSSNTSLGSGTRSHTNDNCKCNDEPPVERRNNACCNNFRGDDDRRYNNRPNSERYPKEDTFTPKDDFAYEEDFIEKEDFTYEDSIVKEDGFTDKDGFIDQDDFTDEDNWNGYDYSNNGYSDNDNDYSDNNNGYGDNDNDYSDNNNGYGDNDNGYSDNDNGYGDDNNGYGDDDRDNDSHNDGHNDSDNDSDVSDNNADCDHSDPPCMSDTCDNSYCEDFCDNDSCFNDNCDKLCTCEGSNKYTQNKLGNYFRGQGEVLPVGAGRRAYFIIKNPHESDIDIFLNKFTHANLGAAPVRVNIFYCATMTGNLMQADNIVTGNSNNCSDTVATAQIYFGNKRKISDGTPAQTICVPAYTTISSELDGSAILSPGFSCIVEIISLAETDRSYCIESFEWWETPIVFFD